MILDCKVIDTSSLWSHDVITWQSSISVKIIIVMMSWNDDCKVIDTSSLWSHDVITLQSVISHHDINLWSHVITPLQGAFRDKIAKPWWKTPCSLPEGRGFKPGRLFSFSLFRKKKTRGLRPRVFGRLHWGFSSRKRWFTCTGLLRSKSMMMKFMLLLRKSPVQANHRFDHRGWPRLINVWSHFCDHEVIAVVTLRWSNWSIVLCRRCATAQIFAKILQKKWCCEALAHTRTLD